MATSTLSSVPASPGTAPGTRLSPPPPSFAHYPTFPTAWQHGIRGQYRHPALYSYCPIRHTKTIAGVTASRPRLCSASCAGWQIYGEDRMFPCSNANSIVSTTAVGRPCESRSHSLAVMGYTFDSYHPTCPVPEMRGGAAVWVWTATNYHGIFPEHPSIRVPVTRCLACPAAFRNALPRPATSYQSVLHRLLCSNHSYYSAAPSCSTSHRWHRELRADSKLIIIYCEKLTSPARRSQSRAQSSRTVSWSGNNSVAPQNAWSHPPTPPQY